MPPKNHPKPQHIQTRMDIVVGSPNASPDPTVSSGETPLPNADAVSPKRPTDKAEQDAEYDRVDGHAWNNGTTTRARAGMTEIDFSARKQPLKELSKVAVDKAVEAARGARQGAGRRKPRVFRTHKDKRWADEPPEHIRKQTGRK